MERPITDGIIEAAKMYLEHSGQEPTAVLMSERMALRLGSEWDSDESPFIKDDNRCIALQVPNGQIQLRIYTSHLVEPDTVRVGVIEQIDRMVKESEKHYQNQGA